jgi:hypothetical protein
MRPDHNLFEQRNRSAIPSYICYAAFLVLGVGVEFATHHLGAQRDARFPQETLHVAMTLFTPFAFPIYYSLATIGRSLLSRAREANNRTGYRVLQVGLFLLRCSVFGYLGAILAGFLLDWGSILMPLHGVLATSAIVFAFSTYAPGINQGIAARTPRALLVSFVLLLIAAGNAAAWTTSLRLGFLSPSVASAIQLLTILTCVTIALVLFSVRLAANAEH